MRNRSARLTVSLLALSIVFLSYTVTAHVPDTKNIEGRMTGGGSIITGPFDIIEGQASAGTEIEFVGSRVTHGFELHCNWLDDPNNLEINFHPPDGGQGSRFKLETLEFSHCWDDASITPNPPYAPFDHYWGYGFGAYNGVDGFCINWLFTDAGERGINDRIGYLRIWTGGLYCPVSAPGLPERFVVWIDEPGHPLTFGNHQAHKETGKTK